MRKLILATAAVAGLSIVSFGAAASVGDRDRFGRLDQNGDGVLTADELSADLGVTSRLHQRKILMNVEARLQG